MGVGDESVREGPIRDWRRIAEERDVPFIPYALRARKVKATAKRLSFELNSGVTIHVPIKNLGVPWTRANAKDLAEVRLAMGGIFLWWDDLEDGVVVGELMAAICREESIRRMPS